MTNKICICLFFFLFGCGTLGSIGSNIHVDAPKQSVLYTIDWLYKSYPQYQIPAKWKSEDGWPAAGYSFLETRIFYFKEKPEEMYYVSFLEDGSNETTIGIRSVFQGETMTWLNDDKLSRKEEKRIAKRFNDEIMVKLSGI